MNDFVDAGRKFWRIDEANATNNLKNLSELRLAGCSYDANSMNEFIYKNINGQ